MTDLQQNAAIFRLKATERRAGRRPRTAEPIAAASVKCDGERKKERIVSETKGRFLPRGRSMVILPHYYDKTYSLTHLSCMGGGREI